MSVPLRDEMFSGPHVSYVESGMASQGATFAAERLQP
jgi:cutinase